MYNLQPTWKFYNTILGSQGSIWNEDIGAGICLYKLFSNVTDNRLKIYDLLVKLNN